QLRDIQFNAEAADCLISSVAPYPVGSRVQLNTSEIGIVVDVNNDDRERPVVRVLFNADGSKCRSNFEVDLAKEQSLAIVKSIS
ncbi:MAG: HD-GYP domain-containing protein, partial [Firmicutes bacterium]|nr:HD-GYP domain-containing protein [Bacillota bacterium]